MNWRILTILSLLIATPVFAQPDSQAYFDEQESLNLALEQAQFEYGPYGIEILPPLENILRFQLENDLKDEALGTYRDIISNLRINYGPMGLEQIPYISEMIDIYFTREDFDTADNWLNIYRNIFRDDDMELNRVVGFSEVIEKRYGDAPKHRCWEIDAETGIYSSYKAECREYRKARIEHFIKAVHLQQEAVYIILNNDLHEDIKISNLEFLIQAASFTKDLIYIMRLDSDMMPLQAYQMGVQDYRMLREQKYNSTHYNSIISNAKRDLNRLISARD